MSKYPYHHDREELKELLQQYDNLREGKPNSFIEEESFVVESGQGIHILPRVKHYIENRSKKDLEFLVISQPSTNNDRFVVE